MQSDQPDKKSNSVKSVLKALLIIEELDRSGELSIGDLSKRLDMDKGTVHRLINTIKDAGYVCQNSDSKKYSNSLKFLAMGNRTADRTGVKHIARPIMEELAKTTKETVNLGIMVGDKVVYVDKLESHSTIKVDLRVGTSVPSYCTGLGKAILAHTPEGELLDILDEISYEKFTEKSIVGQASLLDEFQKIRDAGCSVDDEEYVIGLICIAAPIFDYHGNPIAAISVASPKYRFEEDVHLDLYSSLVINAAERVSAQLGFRAGTQTV